MTTSTPAYRTEFDQVMADQGRRNDWIAEHLGVSVATVSRWRQGLFAPGEDNQRKLTNLLGRNIEFRLELQPNPIRQTERPAA